MSENLGEISTGASARVTAHTKYEGGMGHEYRKSSVWIFFKIFSQARRSRWKRQAKAMEWVGGVGRWYLRGPNNPNKEQTARVL